LLRRRPEVRVLLVGGGPQEAALEGAGRSGWACRTRWCSPAACRTPKVQRYYDLVDVLAYPRHSMRLTELVTPLKPLEAMAQGRLLVASDVGGHQELIRHGQTGVLFAAGRRDALVDALDSLLGRRQDWPALRAAGRRFVETERHWAKSVSAYREPYSRLVPEAAR
jgi:phosphatidylinositol alpha-1,6-mannosyltransferase